MARLLSTMLYFYAVAWWLMAVSRGRNPGLLAHSDGLQRKEKLALNGELKNGEAGDEAAFPWHVFVVRPFTACSGSIVSREWVLTAAHCVEQVSPWLILVLASGSESKLSAVHFVSSYVLHDEYNAFSRRFDIAVLRVSQPFIFTGSVQPIALPTHELTSGTTGTLIEFCHTEDSANGLVISNRTVCQWEDCVHYYGLPLSWEMVCAVPEEEEEESEAGGGGGDDAASCVAEAGSLLVGAGGGQVGVLAWPGRWSAPHSPVDVYVDVFHALRWIEGVCDL